MALSLFVGLDFLSSLEFYHESHNQSNGTIFTFTTRQYTISYSRFVKYFDNETTRMWRNW